MNGEKYRKRIFFRHTLTKEPNKLDQTLGSIDKQYSRISYNKYMAGWSKRELIEPKTACEKKSNDAARIRLLHNSQSHSHPLIQRETFYKTLKTQFT